MTFCGAWLRDPNPAQEPRRLLILHLRAFSQRQLHGRLTRVSPHSQPTIRTMQHQTVTCPGSKQRQQPRVGQAAAFIRRFASHQTNQTTTTPTTTPTTTTPPSSLVLGFGGDLQILDYQIPLGMLDAITDILTAPDLMFANLETVVGTHSEVGPPPINKRFNFLSPPEAIDQIVASGIDVLGRPTTTRGTMVPAGRPPHAGWLTIRCWSGRGRRYPFRGVRARVR